MRIFRYFGYLFLILFLFFAPLYALARIILPDWLKDQVASHLPVGSTLKVDDIYSTTTMGIVYKNILLERTDISSKLYLDNLLIEPNLDIKKPAIIKINNGRFINQDVDLRFKKLKSKIIIENFREKKINLLGDIKEIQGVDLATLKNLEFFITGLNVFEKSILAQIEELEVKVMVPEGPINLNFSSLNLNANINKNLIADISAKKGIFDLSALGRGNSNRIIYSDKININFDFTNNEKWVFPFQLNTQKLSSPLGEIGDFLSIKATGVWRNTELVCTLRDILNEKVGCGKMTDVVKINILFKQGPGQFEFLGNGYCVTPNAGCLQKIESEIKTRNTADIVSKVMLSGIIDPLIGGIILGALLSDPTNKNDEYDHKANIKVEGNKIYLNGKPII